MLSYIHVTHVKQVVLRYHIPPEISSEHYKIKLSVIIVAKVTIFPDLNGPKHFVIFRF